MKSLEASHFYSIMTIRGIESMLHKNASHHLIMNSEPYRLQTPLQYRYLSMTAAIKYSNYSYDLFPKHINSTQTGKFNAC